MVLVIAKEGIISYSRWQVKRDEMQSRMLHVRRPTAFICQLFGPKFMDGDGAPVSFLLMFKSQKS